MLRNIAIVVAISINVLACGAKSTKPAQAPSSGDLLKPHDKRAANADPNAPAATDNTTTTAAPAPAVATH